MFDALSDDQAFDLCFPGLATGEKIEDGSNFDINKMPYVLGFSKRSKYGNCKYCNKYNCNICVAPYDTEQTVNDCLRVNELTTNNTLFSESHYNRGREFGLQITWHRSIDAGLFNYLSNSAIHKSIDAQEETKGEKPDEADTQTAVAPKRKPKSDITLQDCFNEFKVTETLDEDNKWYCNKCKEHV